MSADGAAVAAGPGVAARAPAFAGRAAPSSPAALADAPAAGGTAVEPLSHAGRVFVDLADDGQWYLTDVLTLETKPLPAGVREWLLEVHPETGRAVAYNDDCDEVVIVDEFMQKQLYQPTGGDSGLVLVEASPNDGEVKERPLDELRIRVREGRLKVQLGATTGATEFSAFVFCRERVAGSRVFFNVTGIYHALRLDQYKGQPSKWFYNQHKQWSQRLIPVLGVGHITHSTQSEKEAIPFADMCLPRPAISTCAFVMLLAIWSSSVAQDGGFEKAPHKAAARDSLTGLLRCVLSSFGQEKWSCRVTFDPAWVPSWPRPEGPRGHLRLEFTTSAAGVCISEWRRAAREAQCLVASQAWDAAAMRVFGDNIVPAAELVMRCAAQPATRYIAAQLVWCMSRRFEHVLLHLAVDHPIADIGCTFEWLGFDEILCKQHDLDKRLRSYVQSCRTCRSDWQYVSAVTDKGDGGGLPLQQTIIAFPDNQAFYAVPQVDSAFDNGDDTAGERGERAAKRRRTENGLPVDSPAQVAERPRHAAWVRKGKDPTARTSWRPKPVFRVAAKRALAMLDNQLRVSTPLAGLAAFQHNPLEGRWADSQWRQWPHLSVGHDLGPDVLCASLAAQNHFRLNYTMTPDIDHGCQRSLMETLKSAGVYEFFLLMVVSFNLPNGYQNNDYRYHQLLEATARLAKVHSARSCVPSNR